MREKQLAEAIAQLILEKKGSEILILDVRGLTSIADYFVIGSADTDIQVKAIVGHIKEQLLDQSIKPWHTEGFHTLSWVLLDFVDVVVHIFQRQTREFYGLERLWGDARISEIKEENETPGLHQKEH